MPELKLLTDEEYKILEALSKAIIPAGDNPKTDPGAIETEAAVFLDEILSNGDHYFASDFKEGLLSLNKLAYQKHQKAFYLLSKEQDDLLRVFAADDYLSFNRLRKMIFQSFYSNYTKEDYQGISPWELIGYLGPVTYTHASAEMINRHYHKSQTDKTFTLD